MFFYEPLLDLFHGLLSYLKQVGLIKKKEKKKQVGIISLQKI